MDLALKAGWFLGRLLLICPGLEPYWGKPDVRNLRGGGWKRDYESRTEAHGESRGLATGLYGARASALPDAQRD